MSHRDHRGGAKDGGREFSQRQLRVGELIRHSLAQLFARGEIRDPDLFDVSITVSEVRMTPDLKIARAFVLPLGGANTAKVLDALERCAGFVRGRVARDVKLKFSPKIEFRVDDRFDYADRIDTILHDPRVAGDLDHDADAGPDHHPDTD